MQHIERNDASAQLSICRLRALDETRALVRMARHGVDSSPRLKGQQAEDCHFVVTA
jgi:hypothetical protein